MLSVYTDRVNEATIIGKFCEPEAKKRDQFFHVLTLIGCVPASTQGLLHQECVLTSRSWSMRQTLPVLVKLQVTFCKPEAKKVLVLLCTHTDWLHTCQRTMFAVSEVRTTIMKLVNEAIFI